MTPAQLKKRQLDLLEKIKTLKAEEASIRKSLSIKYAPQCDMLDPGTHTRKLEDGTEVKIVIKDKSTWDSDGLKELIERDPRFEHRIRAKYDVLEKDLKRIPNDEVDAILSCRVLKREDPIITFAPKDDEDED